MTPMLWMLTGAGAMLIPLGYSVLCHRIQYQAWNRLLDHYRKELTELRRDLQALQDAQETYERAPGSFGRQRTMWG